MPGVVWLAVFFALHNLFDRTRDLDAGIVHLELPVLSAWDPVAFAITGVALAVMFWRGWSPLRTLGLCALLGVGVANALPSRLVLLDLPEGAIAGIEGPCLQLAVASPSNTWWPVPLSVTVTGVRPYSERPVRRTSPPSDCAIAWKP